MLSFNFAHEQLVRCQGMAPRIFTRKDGLVAVDLIHCGIDHLTAAELLFQSGPHLYDSAGYLAHLGIEMLLKGWLLEVNGSFEGVHQLSNLYDTLVGSGAARPLEPQIASTLDKLDGYEKLRYPSLVNPTEVGEEDWNDIEL